MPRDKHIFRKNGRKIFKALLKSQSALIQFANPTFRHGDHQNPGPHLPSSAGCLLKLTLLAFVLTGCSDSRASFTTPPIPIDVPPLRHQQAAELECRQPYVDSHRLE
jgi:hypothetical protein